jgi:hypothetical protein
MGGLLLGRAGRIADQEDVRPVQPALVIRQVQALRPRAAEAAALQQTASRVLFWRDFRRGGRTS